MITKPIHYFYLCITLCAASVAVVLYGFFHIEDDVALGCAVVSALLLTGAVCCVPKIPRGW